MKIKDIKRCDACPYMGCLCSIEAFCPFPDKTSCFYGEDCLEYIVCLCSVPCDNIIKE